MLGGKQSETVKTLRFQLKEPRSWENMTKKSNIEFLRNHYEIPERETKLEDELKRCLRISNILTAMQ